MSNNNFDDDDEYEVKVNKMMGFVPVFEDFQRMMDMNPKEFGAKPKFTDRSLEEEWERARYTEFRDWNVECMFGMYEDDREHLQWLYEWIEQGKVRNMDMEHCGEFPSMGIYFDKKKRLVIYNGR
jgi:hypothetical protein